MLYINSASVSSLASNSAMVVASTRSYTGSLQRVAIGKPCCAWPRDWRRPRTLSITASFVRVRAAHIPQPAMSQMHLGVGSGGARSSIARFVAFFYPVARVDGDLEVAIRVPATFRNIERRPVNLLTCN